MNNRPVHHKRMTDQTDRAAKAFKKKNGFFTNLIKAITPPFRCKPSTSLHAFGTCPLSADLKPYTRQSELFFACVLSGNLCSAPKGSVCKKL